MPCSAIPCYDASYRGVPCGTNRLIRPFMTRSRFILFAGLLAFMLGSVEFAAASNENAALSSFQVAQGPKHGAGPGGRGPKRGGPRAKGPQGGGQGPEKAPQKGADCSGAGPKAAAQTGGKVLSVSGGGGSCSVTVLVPGEGGGRPRKRTVTIRP